VIAEETERLVGRHVSSPFMLVALPLCRTWQKQIPAVCHVDGTSRIQTVSRHDSKWVRDILEIFYSLTGIPVVLNTSFNAAGKPIVETPEDALIAFKSMPIDALAVEDWYLEKPGSSASER
jgi:carbamoyltransferase